jgi:hypothetical protein
LTYLKIPHNLNGMGGIVGGINPLVSYLRVLWFFILNF